MVSEPTDQIFSLRHIMEKSWEFKKNVCVLFVDFKVAYHSVHQQSLFNILKQFNFPNNLIKLIKITLKNTEVKIKVALEILGLATVNTSLR